MNISKHFVIFFIIIPGLFQSCSKEKVQFEPEHNTQKGTLESKEIKKDSFEIIQHRVDDTTFFIKRTYPQRNEILKLFTLDSNVNIQRIEKISSDDSRLRDNKLLLKQYKKIKPKVDRTLLKKILGNYLTATIINDKFFISHWDYFCRNRRIHISDTLIFDKHGCEGYYEQPISNVYKEKNGAIVLEALKYPNLSNQLLNENIEVSKFKFYFNLVEDKEIVIIESDLFGRKNFSYLIHEKHINRFNKLQCTMTNGPCDSYLMDFLHKTNERNILNTLDKN
jgi:hypothetical protein